MNLEQVDSVITELNETLAGKRMYFPCNADIRAALAFMGRYLRDKGGVYASLRDSLNNPLLWRRLS